MSDKPPSINEYPTPPKGKPLSETQQEQGKKYKPIVPITLYFIAQAAHIFINESVAMCVAVTLILIVGGGYGL